MKISHEKGFDLLSEIIRISNSTLDIDTRLKNILHLVSSSLGLKDAALYALDAENSELYLKCYKDGYFLESLAVKGTPLEQLFSEDKNYLLGKNEEDSALLSYISGDEKVTRGGIFPITDDKFYFGALVITSSDEMIFDDEDLRIILPICQEIAGTMRNAQLYARSRNMVEDLLMLNDAWKTMSSTIKLDELLHLTIQKISTILRAKCGLVKLKEEPGRKVSVFFYNAESERLKEALLKVCDMICEDQYEKTEATIFENLEPGPMELSPSFQTVFSTVMAAPLICRENRIGSLALFGREDDSLFIKKDLQLFTTLASQMSAVTNNALLLEQMETINREKEVMVRELSNLFELNKAVMTTIDLDKLLHIILTAVTIGDGFGFNRAMLFLYNEKSGFIQGMMGVGPDSAEEAWRIWADISKKRKTLQDILSEEEEEVILSSKLNELVKSIRVSVNDKSILGLTVINKKPYNIRDATGDARVHMKILERINCRAFATAPLMATGRVVGVILVDNIYNERPITNDDIRLLTIFANQAGVAIDNSILYRNMQNAHKELKETQSKLLHTEKLAALGEMSAGVAHEIRNPLVSIGGFARRLSRKVEENEGKKYVDVICREVERLEAILNEILIFSREEPAEREIHDINTVIDDTLQFFWNDFKKSGIDVFKDLEEIGMVEANYHQLKQVFINLFSNARHAMADGGRLRIRSYETDYEGSDFIMVEVSDTGGGIPYNVMTNIFNPFFTTKNEGTGLGLAITHKILSTYRGDIEVMNNEEGGATFIIKIPALKRKNNLS